MSAALYGPDGFYTSGGQAGRRGDFITSPEVGPLFGTVLARAIDDVWQRVGCPDDFLIVEAGAGPGTLARSILAAQPACLGGRADRYVCVEVADRQRVLHPTGIVSRAAMPDSPFKGVIVANELLDNLPFRLAVYDGGWNEAMASIHGDHWVETLARLADAPPYLPSAVPLGARVPIQSAAAEWMTAARRLLQCGQLIVIDYITPRTAELAVRPWREWLRTYRDHGRGTHYLNDVGRQDITTQVCLDQLIATMGEPDQLRSQAQFLKRWGIDALVDEGRRIWQEQASRPGLVAMRARSRISESEALLDPHGLGAFTVAEWTVDSPA